MFISSVIVSFEEYRAAAREEVESLGHAAIVAEDFSASPSSSRQASICLQLAKPETRPTHSTLWPGRDRPLGVRSSGDKLRRSPPQFRSLSA